MALSMAKRTDANERGDCTDAVDGARERRGECNGRDGTDKTTRGGRVQSTVQWSRTMTRIKPSDLILVERGKSWEEEWVDGTRNVTGRASCLEGNGIYSQQLVVEAAPAGRVQRQRQRQWQTKPSLAGPAARASRAVHDMHEHGEEEGPRNKCMCAMSRLESGGAVDASQRGDGSGRPH